MKEVKDISSIKQSQSNLVNDVLGGSNILVNNIQVNSVSLAIIEPNTRTENK